MDTEPEAPAAAAPEDPEIAALLEFEPVVRRNRRHDGWDGMRQRGSPPANITPTAASTR